MDMTAATLVSLSVAAILLAVALFHIFWGVGGVWPGRDKDDLVRKVMGGPPDMTRPGTPYSWLMACLAVAVLSATIAIFALILGGVVFSKQPEHLHGVRMLARVAGAVLALRGVAGFFEARLRPAIRGGPYARLNVRYYSPLFLLLGAGMLFLSLR